jgi:hypothetical protein
MAEVDFTTPLSSRTLRALYDHERSPQQLRSL